VKERLELHNLRTDHVMIQSELKDLMVTKVAGTVKWNLGPGLEPNWAILPVQTLTTASLPGPIANTRLQDELKYLMYVESEESTVMPSKVMRIAHLKAIETPKISSTGTATGIIQMPAKTIAWQMMNRI